MAVLYFINGTDWSNPAYWFYYQGGVGYTPAGRIPNSSDEAILQSNITDISGAYENPAVLQLGAQTSSIGFANWSGSSFTNTTPINFNFPVVKSEFCTNIWFDNTTGGNTYTVGTLNIGSGNSNVTFEGEVTVTNVANFYNSSSNGGPDAHGTIIGNAVFNGNSTNANENNGTITGNATFNGSSINGSPNGGNAIVGGNATFNGFSSNGGIVCGNSGNAIFTGNSSNGTNFSNGISRGFITYFYESASNCYLGFPSYYGACAYDAIFYQNSTNASVSGNTFTNGYVNGTIRYNSSYSFSTSLQGAAHAQEINYYPYSSSGGGGINNSKLFLNRLLRLPFPVVLT